jgi:hypothetical protein
MVTEKMNFWPRKLHLAAVFALAVLIFSWSAVRADDGGVSSGTGASPTQTFFSLITAPSGSGAGTVTASPAGPTYAPGTVVTLTATPASESTFSGWSGVNCGAVTTCKASSGSSLTLCGTQPTCQITVGSSNVVVLAGFAPGATTAAGTFTLTTATTGSGTGTISASPSGLAYSAGTVVILIANPAAGSAFGGWAGDCTNPTPTSCAVTMNSNHTVTATFTTSSPTAVPSGTTFSLITGTRGDGAGTVTASPAGPYAPGTVVTLTATPTNGSTIGAWLGASCGASSTCKVSNTSTFTSCGAQTTCQITTGSTNVVVLAQFNPAGSGNTFTLTTSAAGSGTGTISASPSGPSYTAGTVVTLTATAASGATFSGWAGDCANPTSLSCAITMNSSHAVSAAFTLSSQPATATKRLTVNLSGNGSVKSSPRGLDCGTDCTASFAAGQSVLLVALPGSGAQFNSWSGCTTNTATTCWVTLSADTTVTATFGAGNGVALHQGTVYSSAQGTSQSYLRFYNDGTSAGTVTIALSDATSGQAIGQWTSPSIAPETAPQYSIADIESVLPSGFSRPNIYSLSIQSQFEGTFQHIVYTPSVGLLTNFSTCDAGVSVPSRLVNVHSSLLSIAGFPSSVALYNTGTAAAAVTLALYDARNANLLGTYTTESLPPNSQLVISVATMEAAAGIAPTANMMHYVVSVEGSFTGYLRHLVNNVRPGVTTDLSTVCAFSRAPASSSPSGS